MCIFFKIHRGFSRLYLRFLCGFFQKNFFQIQITINLRGFFTLSYNYLMKLQIYVIFPKNFFSIAFFVFQKLVKHKYSQNGDFSLKYSYN